MSERWAGCTYTCKAMVRCDRCDIYLQHQIDQLTAERDRYKAERDELLRIIDGDLIIYDCHADVRDKINKIKEG